MFVICCMLNLIPYNITFQVLNNQKLQMWKVWFQHLRRYVRHNKTFGLKCLTLDVQQWGTILHGFLHFSQRFVKLE